MPLSLETDHQLGEDPLQNMDQQEARCFHSQGIQIGCWVLDESKNKSKLEAKAKKVTFTPSPTLQQNVPHFFTIIAFLVFIHPLFLPFC